MGNSIRVKTEDNPEGLMAVDSSPSADFAVPETHSSDFSEENLQNDEMGIGNVVSEIEEDKLHDGTQNGSHVPSMIVETLEPSNTYSQLDHPMNNNEDIPTINLEYVEDHCRHANSFVDARHTCLGYPLNLGRDIFRYHDKKKRRNLISRNHCSIHYNPPKEDSEVGTFVVFDHSANGTFVNQHRVDPEHGTVLKHGDIIGFLTTLSGPIETYMELSGKFRVNLGLRFLIPPPLNLSSSPNTSMISRGETPDPSQLEMTTVAHTKTTSDVDADAESEGVSSIHAASTGNISDEFQDKNSDQMSECDAPKTEKKKYTPRRSRRSAASGPSSRAATPSAINHMRSTSEDKPKSTKKEGMITISAPSPIRNSVLNFDRDTDGDDERDSAEHPSERQPVINVIPPNYGNFVPTDSAEVAPVTQNSLASHLEAIATASVPDDPNPVPSHMRKRSRTDDTEYDPNEPMRKMVLTTENMNA